MMNDIEIVKHLLGIKQGVYEPLITSTKDFFRVHEAYLAQEDEQSQTRTSDDPKTDQDFVICVARVVDALLSVEYAVDAYKDDARDQKKTATEFTHSISAFELQLTAWRIVVAVFHVHRGRYSIPSWGKNSPKVEDFQTFEDRLTAVLSVLRQSKAACKNVFDSQTSWLHRIAMQPKSEMSRKKENNTNNTERQERYSNIQRQERVGFRPRPTKRPRLMPSNLDLPHVENASTMDDMYSFNDAVGAATPTRAALLEVSSNHVEQHGSLETLEGMGHCHDEFSLEDL